MYCAVDSYACLRNLHSLRRLRVGSGCGNVWPACQLNCGTGVCRTRCVEGLYRSRKRCEGLSVQRHSLDCSPLAAHCTWAACVGSHCRRCQHKHPAKRGRTGALQRGCRAHMNCWSGRKTVRQAFCSHVLRASRTFNSPDCVDAMAETLRLSALVEGLQVSHSLLGLAGAYSLDAGAVQPTTSPAVQARPQALKVESLQCKVSQLQGSVVTPSGQRGEVDAARLHLKGRDKGCMVPRGCGAGGGRRKEGRLRPWRTGTPPPVQLSELALAGPSPVWLTTKEVLQC